jgi:HEAT repeat protein
VAIQDRVDQVELAIVRLLTSKNGEEIEALADDLGRLGDRRAVGPLVSRLADSRVHDDPDLEDAVCSSLVRLGAMERGGNLNYSFVSPSRLSSESAAALGRLATILPRRYFRAT